MEWENRLQVSRRQEQHHADSFCKLDLQFFILLKKFGWWYSLLLNIFLNVFIETFRSLRKSQVKYWENVLPLSVAVHPVQNLLCILHTCKAYLLWWDLFFSGCILIPNSYCSEVAFNTQHSSQIWSRIISWNSELVNVPSQSLMTYSVTLGTEVHKAPPLFHGIFQARILEWVAISFSWGRNSAIIIPQCNI